MEIASFRHQSDSRYCFSISPTQVLLRLACAKSVNLENVTVIYGDPMTFGKKHREQGCVLRHTDQGYHYYETIIDVSPARLMYVFRVKGEGRECYFAESGLCDSYKFDLAFISAFQFVGENENDYVKESPSWQGKVIYQIFVERFACGGGDKPYVNTPWNTPTLVKKPKAMLGGDIAGITQKLDYLQELGIGAIYLTPVHPSPSNHKYDVLDYYDIDAGFGGKKAFLEFVQESKKRGINVMMDMVFNHVSSQHPFFLDVVERGKESLYYSYFFINGNKPTKYPLNYRCFGYVAGMPKLNTNNKEVQNYLIGVASYYAKEYGIDGFRLDVSEGVSHDLWIKMKIALKEINPNIILIGENWLNSESYLGPNQLDGVMNYPFLGVVSGYVLRIKNALETAEGLEGLLMRYKDGHSKMMMNVLSTHDIQRFTTLVGGDKDLALIGYAISMFYWGYPLVYYGDEIFMEGGGDPDNRRGMRWDSPVFDSYHHRCFKSLIQLRKNMSLKVGDIDIHSENGLLVIRRTYGGKSLTLYCNMQEKEVVFGGEPILSNKVGAGVIWPHGFAVIAK